MSDIIDSIKQSASQVLTEIDQRVQLKSTLQGIRSQWGEMDRRRKMGALKNQIKSYQDEMKQLTEALGLQTLSLYDAKKIQHEELSRLCERINELRSELEMTKAELAALRVQERTITKCPQCQANIEARAAFCSKCGVKIDAVLPEQPAARPAPAAPAAPVKSKTPAKTAAPKSRVVKRFRCPKCKTIVDSQVEFCPTCGVKFRHSQKLAAAKRFCASCGSEMTADARFCPVCGKSAG